MLQKGKRSDLGLSTITVAGQSGIRTRVLLSYLRAGSVVKSIPNFLNVLQSTSLSITVECA